MFGPASLPPLLLELLELLLLKDPVSLPASEGAPLLEAFASSLLHALFVVTTPMVVTSPAKPNRPYTFLIMAPPKEEREPRRGRCDFVGGARRGKRRASAQQPLCRDKAPSNHDERRTCADEPSTR
jgi:hypothetical protein